MRAGSKVTYHTPHKTEIGIVKSFHPITGQVFVVYNCGEAWEHYKQYTAASTDRKDLIEGWWEVDENGVLSVFPEEEEEEESI